MGEEYMTPEEQKQLVIDKYTDLLRIKSDVEGRSLELEKVFWQK